MAQMATRNFDQRVTDRAIVTRSLNIFPSVFSLGILTFLKLVPPSPHSECLVCALH